MRALFFVGLLFTALCAQAQTDTSRAQTQQRLEELQRQIAEDQQRLSQTRQAEEVSMETLTQLERQIAAREALLKTYRRRMGELTTERATLATELDKLTDELETLKKQYRARAVHVYKRGRLNDLALILSSHSVNEMVRRTRYLRRFARQRERRLARLEEAAVAVQQRRRQITASAQEARRMVSETQQQQQQLGALRGSRARVVTELRSQRTAIEAEIARKREAARRLEAQIRTLVASENARRLERDDAEETAAFVALSGSFEQNRGKLPWPSEGVVTEPFGEVTNPATGTRTLSTGLLVATRPGVAVRAVFEGVVMRVDAMPDFGTYVLVQHGDYQSLYSNFSSVSVRSGTRVQAGEVIGRSGTADQPRGAGVFFALFKAGQAINPAPWLQGR